MKDKRVLFLIELLSIAIITIPAFISLLNNQYFPMHDDQHVARLFLLDQALHQGSLYPRWVGGLGFGYGYPLFNFYPPLIYYVAEVFHLAGLSLIASIKAMIMIGFIGGAVGMYLWAKQLMGRAAAVATTTFYTFFSYHAVLIYVRGAYAEFFALAILPFVFLTLGNLYKNTSKKNAILFGLSFAALILSHPLIAVPTLIYLGLMYGAYLTSHMDRTANLKKILYFMGGLATTLCLSAFFWLPSMLERRFTMVDNILLTELANYKIHFVYPSQFWYSIWGYGGSIVGPFDGFSFQLGKIHLIALGFSVILSGIYLYFIKTNRLKNKPLTAIKYFYLFLFLTVFSLFMTTSYSSVIWESIRPLSYLQFPWRFLTFATIFLSLSAGFSVYFLTHLFKKLNTEIFLLILSLALSGVVIFKYQKYFHPQRYITVNDSQKTTTQEISWAVSRSSFEFIPKTVKTTKSELNTTIPAITPQTISQTAFVTSNQNAKIRATKDTFHERVFKTSSKHPFIFQLNTFFFPGWTAFLDEKRIPIRTTEDLQLIWVNIPQGSHTLTFKFEDTPVRKVANMISVLSLFGVAVFALKNLVTLKNSR